MSVLTKSIDARLDKNVRKVLKDAKLDGAVTKLQQEIDQFSGQHIFIGTLIKLAADAGLDWSDTGPAYPFVLDAARKYIKATRGEEMELPSHDMTLSDGAKVNVRSIEGRKLAANDNRIQEMCGDYGAVYVSTVSNAVLGASRTEAAMIPSELGLRKA